MQAPTATGLSRAAMSELPLQLQPDRPRSSDEQPGPVRELRAFGNQVADDSQLVEYVTGGESELPRPLIHTGAQIQQSVRAQVPAAVCGSHVDEAGTRTRKFILRPQECRSLSARHDVLSAGGTGQAGYAGQRLHNDRTCCF